PATSAYEMRRPPAEVAERDEHLNQQAGGIGFRRGMRHPTRHADDSGLDRRPQLHLFEGRGTHQVRQVRRRTAPEPAASARNFLLCLTHWWAFVLGRFPSLRWGRRDAEADLP